MAVHLAHCNMEKGVAGAEKRVSNSEHMFQTYAAWKDTPLTPCDVFVVARHAEMIEKGSFGMGQLPRR